MPRVMDPVIEELRETLLLMGIRAEAIIGKATRALLERDGALAAEVAEDDLEIDRLDVRVDEQVLKALALQAPVAADLREVVAIKMIATDLERVGDIARNIAECAVRLARQPATPIAPALAGLAMAASEALRRALNAFSECNADVARAVLEGDDAIDQTEDEVVRQQLEGITSRSDQVSAAVDMILVAKNLERIGDHATNIAEDVILMAEARNVKHAEKLRGRRIHG